MGERRGPYSTSVLLSLLTSATLPVSPLAPPLPPPQSSLHDNPPPTYIRFSTKIWVFFVVVSLYKWNHTLYTLVSWFPKVSITFMRLCCCVEFWFILLVYSIPQFIRSVIIDIWVISSLGPLRIVLFQTFLYMSFDVHVYTLLLRNT